MVEWGQTVANYILQGEWNVWSLLFVLEGMGNEHFNLFLIW